jgi:signal transduction histidine kinase
MTEVVEALRVPGAPQTDGDRYQAIFESAPVAMWELDLSGVVAWLAARGISDRAALDAAAHGADLIAQAAAHGRVLDVNEQARALLGGAAKETLVGPLSGLLGRGLGPAWRAIVRAILDGDEALEVESTLAPATGEARDVLVSVRIPPQESPAHLRHVVLSMLDTTERKALETQVRAVQRVESIGRLAGGVAHDFNNILAVVMSHADFLLATLEPGSPALEDVQVIRTAADRAAQLTCQLLAFSRRQVLKLQIVKLNTSITGIDRMLRRVIGDNIEIRSELAPDVWPVEADAAQIDQILMNLAVNARDAMPDGGTLTFRTRNVVLDDQDGRREGFRIVPGEYVMLSVGDTGIGMDADTRLRIFEPFFTTKQGGKGSGLGLSTVYGIVKQSQGYIWVRSEPGRGATFEIYLPRTSSSESPAPAPRPAARLGGHETILLVEDDPGVRAAARRILARQGYGVIEAASGEEALSHAQSRTQPIHLLLADLLMPGLTGAETARRLLASRPQTRVLFMSGYSDEAVSAQGVDPAALVAKPFTAEVLLVAVREALGRA